ncbi:Hypothetical predicted protein [Mytilus galloprovincialis]|uniref:Uncharacterized protein n=1 Tax=Mytilus galloprovincialis TaxID=29158 RepID=A0A8B6CS27_MYTGA|nr:Hypothetical predicted protein [Mytilus galloprovincialis]
MGICFGWLSRGNLLSHQNPPPLDREETYKDCKIYFHESHEKADQLQQNFANKVIQSKRNIEKAKKKAEEELRKSKKTKPLKDKEAEEIVKNIQKENDWLKRSRNTITDLLAKLNDVNEHESRFMGEQPNQTNYDTLIVKQMSKVRKVVRVLVSVQNTLVKLESNYGVESDDTCDIDERQGRPVRHKRQMQDFILLYECTLIIENSTRRLL